MRHFWWVLVLFCAPAVAGTIEVPERDEAARSRGERSPQLRVVSTAAPWLRKTEHAGVVYFLHAFPPRIKRYALATQGWLPDIALSAAPRGFAVSNAGIFVSQNTTVSRFNLDGSGESALGTVWANADDFNVAGPYLVTSRDLMLQSVRIADGAEVAVYSTAGGYEPPQRFAVAQGASALYGWQRGVIMRIALNPDGTFGGGLTGPYHGTFPAGSVVYPDSSGLVLMDDAGLAFDGQSLTFRSGTGGPINDTVVFNGNRYVLRSDSVARLNAGLQETGAVALAQEAHGIAALGDRLFLFANTGVEVIALARFSEIAQNPPSPAAPFIADSVDMADDGTLFLFNKAQRVVHRFSTSQWDYLPSVALPQHPLFASVDRANARVYVAYEGGRIGVIAPGARDEQFLAFGPVSAVGMGAADEFVMTADRTGAWASHRVYNLAGVETAWREWNHLSGEYIWNRATRRMYFYRDNISPNDLHFETLSTAGAITAAGETPYHGQVQAQLPIRPSPTGALVYIGSGQVYDGVSLNLAGSMPIPPNDAAWLGTVLYTLNALAAQGVQRLVRWNQDNTVSTEGELTGSSARLFTSSGQIITVATVNGRTVIKRWPASLSGRDVTTTITQISPATPHGAPLSFTVEVTHHGLEASADIQLDIALSSPIAQLSWLCNTVQGSIPCGSSTGLQLVRSLAVGETLRASASGYMPMDATDGIRIQAVASNVASELRPADNTATGQIGLDDVLFAHGFE